MFLLAESTTVATKVGSTITRTIRLRRKQRVPAIAIVAFSSILSSITDSIAAGAMTVGNTPSTRLEYQLPSWAEMAFSNPPPHGRLDIANLPTPLYKWTFTPQTRNKADNKPSLLYQKIQDLGINLFIKRDDMSGGVETGGNKIRKLEFLLADAVALGKQGVVTIGGEQSNHCRATAAAAVMVGLEPHLILRTKRADAVQDQKEDIGFVGNILFDRMVGSTIYTCTPGEYGRVGSQELVARVCAHLDEETNSSSGAYYPIPVGGSNGIGTWGYINGVDELMSQWNSIQESAQGSSPSLDHVVFACGSGGTAAGIALGIALAHGALDKDTPSAAISPSPKVHAIGVCDNPDYFYSHVAKIAEEMGLQLPPTTTTESFIRQHMTAHNGKGLGYAVNTQEELDFITNIALETGVVLDPVYSGKALYHFVITLLDGDNAEQYRGKNILFWHTGTWKTADPPFVTMVPRLVVGSTFISV